MKTYSCVVLCAAILALVSVPATAGDWAIKADITESCSCNAACPCLFGSPPTHMKCEGSRLVEIEEGEIDGVRVDGVTVLATFSMGEWVKYYVDDATPDDQVEAAANLVTRTLGWKVLSTEKAALKKTHDETKIAFSGPQSKVEIELMTGPNGKATEIHHLPAGLTGYTQYKSLVNSHDSADHRFSYSGTNGFASRLEQSGTD